MPSKKPLTLEDGKLNCFGDDDELVSKQFCFYMIGSSANVKIKDGQVMQTPCINIGGSLEVIGAMEVGK